VRMIVANKTLYQKGLSRKAFTLSANLGFSAFHRRASCRPGG
jgi:hypothetical protein